MIELRHATIRSGPFELSDISLTIPEGVYAILMGGTGQGKTTVLEAICGLRRVTAGAVLLGGVDVTHWKPANRGIGYVPQDLALFPTMTVREHLEFALKLRKASREELRSRVAELSSVLGIESLLGRGVQYLSGGEAQRVALGRALAFRPRVLLLDEPLAALDEVTRDRLCALLKTVQRQNGLTILHITHSRTEAQRLAEQLLVMESRKIRVGALSALDIGTISTEANSSELRDRSQTLARSEGPSV